MTATERFLVELKKHSNVITGTETIATDGVKYRYDRMVLKYNNAANWLVKLFSAAAKENGGKYDLFYIGNDTFSFAAPQFVGQNNGKITGQIYVEL